MSPLNLFAALLRPLALLWLALAIAIPAARAQAPAPNSAAAREAEINAAFERLARRQVVGVEGGERIEYGGERRVRARRRGGGGRGGRSPDAD